MPMLTLNEAAHRVRMTIRLLRWFASYAPKGDSTKLRVVDGTIDSDELLQFDNHLRGAWPTRRVPAGIREELLVEATGRCGVCDDPCEHFEEAHIDRQGKELPHYSQHPHNLILLCGSCHGRYDRGSTVSNPVVRKRKDILLSRLLEDVDRDMALAQLTRGGLATLHRGLVASGGRPDEATARSWVALTAPLFSASGAPPIPLVDPSDASEMTTRLQEVSNIILGTMPITSGTLRAAAERLDSEGFFESPDDAEAWEYIEPEPKLGECMRCGQQTPIDDYTCLDCDYTGYEYSREVPFIDHEASPPTVSLEDARGNSYVLTCKECESENIEVQFEPLCDYCRYQAEKDD